MIRFQIDSQHIFRTDSLDAACGAVEFLRFSPDFSDDWDGYLKTFVFEAGGEKYYVLNVESAGEYFVPCEVLASPGRVRVGCFGTKGSVSTATSGYAYFDVVEGYNPDDSVGESKPSPSLFSQIIDYAESMGERLELGVDNCRIVWRTGSGNEWSELVALSDLKGEQGAKGEKGDPGEAPDGCLLFSKQNLSGDEKSQARENIGAAAADRVSNPAKSSRTGRILRLNGISPISHKASCSASGVSLSVISENLFDKSAVTRGKSISRTNGQISNNSDYSVSDYIPVKPGTAYYFHFTGFYATAGICYFKDNEGHLSGEKTGEVLASANGILGFTHETPSDCAFIRFSYKHSGTNASDEDSAMVVEGNSYPGRYIPYQMVNVQSDSLTLPQFEGTHVIVSPESITVEYQRDLNAVIDELTNAIIALGGSI